LTQRGYSIGRKLRLPSIRNQETRMIFKKGSAMAHVWVVVVAAAVAAAALAALD
jgi:hypothetical protein